MIPVQIVSEDQILPAYSRLIHYAIYRYYPYRQGVEYVDAIEDGE